MLHVFNKSQTDIIITNIKAKSEKKSENKIKNNINIRKLIQNPQRKKITNQQRQVSAQKHIFEDKGKQTEKYMNKRIKKQKNLPSSSSSSSLSSASSPSSPSPTARGSSSSSSSSNFNHSRRQQEKD